MPAGDAGPSAELSSGHDAREKPQPQERPEPREVPGEQYEPEPPFSADEDYEESIPPADYVPPEVENMATGADGPEPAGDAGDADDEPMGEDDAIAALIKSKIGDVPFTIE